MGTQGERNKGISAQIGNRKGEKNFVERLQGNLDRVIRSLLDLLFHSFSDKRIRGKRRIEEPSKSNYPGKSWLFRELFRFSPQISLDISLGHYGEVFFGFFRTSNDRFP